MSTGSGHFPLTHSTYTAILYGHITICRKCKLQNIPGLALNFTVHYNLPSIQTIFVDSTWYVIMRSPPCQKWNQFHMTLQHCLRMSGEISGPGSKAVNLTSRGAPAARLPPLPWRSAPRHDFRLAALKTEHAVYHRRKGTKRWALLEASAAHVKRNPVSIIGRACRIKFTMLMRISYEIHIAEQQWAK